MRELYYAFYKNSSYQVLILTSLAEAIYYRGSVFVNKRLQLKEKTNLNEYEIMILEKVRLGKNSKISILDCDKWYNQILNECIQLGYLKKLWFIHFKTAYFKKMINFDLENCFNKDIVKFINSSNPKFLKDIVKNINKINIPNFKLKKVTSGFKDKLEIVEEASQYWDPH